MADIRDYLNQIQNVDDYYKFKEKMGTGKPFVPQTGKPMGSLNDFYDDPGLKTKQPPRKNFDLNFKDNNLNFNNLDMADSHFLGDSNFLKENLIPRELKEDRNLNKLSRVGELKIFGNEATNESLVENSFLRQLNIKNTGIRNMFEVDRPNGNQPEPEMTGTGALTQVLEKNLATKSHNHGYTNNILKPLTHFDYATLSNKYIKPSSLTSSGNSTFSKFKIPDRPDVKGTYIDNNDIRAYLNSLDNKMVSSDSRSNSQTSNNKARSASMNGKRKNKKNKKMDLSIIEDDMEGEEQENKAHDDRRKKTKKPRKESSESEAEEAPPKHRKEGKRKASRSIYEEDLTKNFSEKDLSLYSANHFNQNYEKPRNKKEFSDNSLPSKLKEKEYLHEKYGKKLPKQDKISEFLDNICEVICMNCGELVDLNTVDDHSLECFKAIGKNSGTEDLSTLNKQLKQIAYQLKKKLKDIKEYINKLEDTEHFYFNHTLMIIECLNQIIQNDQNVVNLVSNIKDINAFNKSLSENRTPLAKFILSMTYRIKPLAKLKIPCIDPNMTWEDAKNVREKSIFNQNLRTENRSMVMRESHRTHNNNNVSILRESAISGSRFLKNGVMNNSSSNISILREEDPIKKEFMQLVVEVKLGLDRNHPGRNWKAEEMLNEVKRMRLGKEGWREYVEGRFNEIGNERE